MAIVVFFIAIWYLSLTFQTLFQHRYASHGAFKMSKGWERVFFVGAWLTQGSSYMSPRAYAIMHRYHHAYTDTALDPHSPSFSKNIFSLMWRTRNFYRAIVEGKMEVEQRFTKALPEWRWFDRMACSNISALVWMAAYTTFFAFFTTSWWQWLFLPVVIAMGGFHGAIINWFAHKYGYVNFRMRNTSMNLFSIDVLMLGESYHNNHHKHPSSINFGRKWHEIDPMYPIIRLLAWARIIRIVKLAPVPAETPSRLSGE